MSPSASNRHASPSQRWRLADIPFDRVRPAPPGGGEEFFYLVAAASFMEAATDLYTRNLVDCFADDEEVSAWLEEFWLSEELQHGQALRRYVEAAWPEFDWEAAYRPFHAEFTTICKEDGVEPGRSREMASRCIVEMGTAAYYTTLSRASPEPVLALLARRIADDEVRHYRHFYRYYRKYQAIERPGRGAVLLAIWHRLRMTGGGDSFAVLKHVHAGHRPGMPFDAAVYRGLRRRCRDAIGRHFPHPMSIKMLAKPLGLGPRAQRLVLPLATALARRLVP